MIKNYLKIALRTMWRDRTFSFINLIGLAVGLASVLMIVAYVRYELSYDKHYTNAANVYRVVMVNKINQVDEGRVYVPTALAQVLQKEFPAVKASTVFSLGRSHFKCKSEIVSMDVINGTADFFKVFNLAFINGDPLTALKEPGSIVISVKTATKYFPGMADPVGKTIFSTDEGKALKITGIIKDIPSNTHFQADAVTSLGTSSIDKTLSMRSFTGLPQYILLNENSHAAELEHQFKIIYKKFDFPASVILQLQPVTSIHLHSHNSDELMPNGDIKYIYIFLSVALLILLIACINYINLATARSLQRAREVGVRKVLGAAKKQLVVQFLSESFLFFMVCLMVAMLLAQAAWPALSEKINSGRQVIALFDASSIIAIILVVIIFGLLSGIYPAFFLSRINTATVLKGVEKFGINISFRKALVGIQFVITGVLIVSTLVIYQQLNFVNNARLGFNKENLITVPFFMYHSHVGSFKNELLADAGITGVTVANWTMGADFGGSTLMPDKKDSTKTLKFQFIDADADFIKTMGIKVLKGRDFSRGIAADVFDVDSATDKIGNNREQYNKVASSKSIIVNEETLKLLDLKYSEQFVIPTGAVKGTVVGEVQNFNGLTLHEKIPALVIRCNPNEEFGQMYIRISQTNIQQTIKYIQNKWSRFYPDQQFEFSFVDQKLQQLYTADKRVGQLFGVFASLAIVIACLGLFGLISLTVQQRVKEIGIRKVLGASVADITTLLSADFLKLVFISMLIASPVAWYLMNKWLTNFAYHINISWMVFALSAMAALLVAFITIGTQAVKAALANPVKSLRSE